MKIKNKKLKTYIGDVYDLKVDTSDTSYNIEDIVVHNSAAGALISYSLNITTIDPVKFGLYFERFLNKDRCLTTNNIILLKDGTSKKIEDVTLKDKVQTSTGRGKLIKILENEVDEEVYTIETENGASVDLTSNHIVPVLRKGKQLEVRVDEILDTDYLFTL